MTADTVPVAHGYNRPERESDAEASFNDLASAQAYAATYGGSIEARGVAFVVGPDADHGKAKDDLAEAQRAVPAAATPGVSEIDAAVERAMAHERAAFEAERAEWLAAHPTPVEPVA